MSRLKHPKKSSTRIIRNSTLLNAIDDAKIKPVVWEAGMYASKKGSDGMTIYKVSEDREGRLRFNPLANDLVEGLAQTVTVNGKFYRPLFIQMDDLMTLKSTSRFAKKTVDGINPLKVGTIYQLMHLRITNGIYEGVCKRVELNGDGEVGAYNNTGETFIMANLRDEKVFELL